MDAIKENATKELKAINFGIVSKYFTKLEDSFEPFHFVRRRVFLK